MMSVPMFRVKSRAMSSSPPGATRIGAVTQLTVAPNGCR